MHFRKQWLDKTVNKWVGISLSESLTQVGLSERVQSNIFNSLRLCYTNWTTMDNGSVFTSHCDHHFNWAGYDFIFIYLSILLIENTFTAMSSLHSTAIQRKRAARMHVTQVRVTHLAFSSTFPYLAFAPISQIRFWGAQVICVATPSAFFVVYSIERKQKSPSRTDHCTSESSAIPKRRPSHAFINMTSATQSTHESRMSTSCREHRLLKAYFCQTVVRLFIELFFFHFQYRLYGTGKVGSN